MYAAKVRLGLADDKSGRGAYPNDGIQAEQDEAESLQETWQDSIEFSAGNPRVEHITGTVHLYREIPEASLDVVPALPVSSAQQYQDCLFPIPPILQRGNFANQITGF